MLGDTYSGNKMPFPAFLGYVPLTLEPLTTNEQKKKGFMGSTTPPPDGFGLLFQNSKVRPQSFWMKNVPFDLDCIGFDEDDRVVEVMHLKANDTASRSFMRAVKNVVEVRGGWCKDKGVIKGQKLVLKNPSLSDILYEGPKSLTDTSREKVVAIPRGSLKGKSITLVFSEKTVLNPEDGTIPKEALAGMIGYRESESTPGLFLVKASVAEKGYGPLLYQLAMKAIHPGWLRCDTYLSQEAANIWIQMFKLQDLYDRKFLGEFGTSELMTAIRASKLSEGVHEALRKMIADTGFGTISPMNEEALRKFIPAATIDSGVLGSLWAYQLKKQLNSDSLYSEGKEMIAALASAAGRTKGSVIVEIEEAAYRLFLERFG